MSNASDKHLLHLLSFLIVQQSFFVVTGSNLTRLAPSLSEELSSVSVSDQCKVLLENFSNSSSKFTRCANQYAKPIFMCGNLGPLGYLLNTTSHHRVHHGTDKKHDGWLSVWDRVFTKQFMDNIKNFKQHFEFSNYFLRSQRDEAQWRMFMTAFSATFLSSDYFICLFNLPPNQQEILQNSLFLNTSAVPS